MTKKKLKYFLIFNLITFLIIFSSSQILAKSNFSFALCEYSQEYEKWLELSLVDQANNIEPVMCKATVVSQKREPYLDYSNIFKTFYTFAAADSSYDLRTIGGVTAVRNQGNNSNCWAYATMASLESYLLINQYGNFDFSERHMDYATIKTFNNSEINQEGFNRELTQGGNILMASAYLIRNSGPIAEQEMPHSNDYGLIDILDIQNKTNLVDVNEIAFFTNSNYSESNCGPGISLKIKEHLSTYGALFANLYMLDDIPYYNSSFDAYYYNGSQMANHSVAIVGWDDNYSKANFIENNQPSRNGAWLVKNSYGNVWGDAGYFYVSYDDPHLCNYLAGITSADEELDDNSYYHDPLGANAYLETEEGSQNYLYGANIFTKKTIEEQLTEVVIMNPVNTLLNYEVYVNAEAREQNEESDEAYLNSPNRELVATGSVNYSGYYTIKLEDPVDLLEEEFAIIVKFIYPTTNQAFLAISIDNSSSNEWYEYLTSSGNSFLSGDMNNWQDAYYNQADENAHHTISIKVSTNSTSYKFDLKTTTYNQKNYFISNISGGTTINNFLLSLNETEYDTIEIYDSQNNILSTGNMATGMIMQVVSGEITRNYTIVVKGDVSGDGNIGSNDALLVRRHVIGLVSLGTAYQMAGDVDVNNALSSLDALKIRRYVVGLGSL